MTPLSTPVRHTFRFSRVVVLRCSPAQDAKQQENKKSDERVTIWPSGTSQTNNHVAPRTKLTTNLRNGQNRRNCVPLRTMQRDMCFASRPTENEGWHLAASETLTGLNGAGTSQREGLGPRTPASPFKHVTVTIQNVTCIAGGTVLA